MVLLTLFAKVVQDNYKIKEVHHAADDCEDSVTFKVLFLFLDDSEEHLLHIVLGPSVDFIKTDVPTILQSIEIKALDDVMGER